MAISRAQLLKELLPGLNELFGLEYDAYVNAWAVHVDYLHETMTYKIIKIEPWALRSLSDPYELHRVVALDEMDAYKQFMERIDKNHQAESGSIINQKAVRDD